MTNHSSLNSGTTAFACALDAPPATRRPRLYNKLLAAAAVATGAIDPAPPPASPKRSLIARTAGIRSQLVVVLDEPGEGWYESIVAETQSEMLALALALARLPPRAPDRSAGADPAALPSVRSTTGAKPKPKTASSEPSGDKTTAYPAEIDLEIRKKVQFNLVNCEFFARKFCTRLPRSTTPR